MHCYFHLEKIYQQLKATYLLNVFWGLRSHELQIIETIIHLSIQSVTGNWLHASPWAREGAEMTRTQRETNTHALTQWKGMRRISQKEGSIFMGAQRRERWSRVGKSALRWLWDLERSSLCLPPLHPCSQPSPSTRVSHHMSPESSERTTSESHKERPLVCRTWTWQRVLWVEIGFGLLPYLRLPWAETPGTTRRECSQKSLSGQGSRCVSHLIHSFIYLSNHSFLHLPVPPFTHTCVTSWHPSLHRPQQNYTWNSLLFIPQMFIDSLVLTRYYSMSWGLFDRLLKACINSTHHYNEVLSLSRSPNQRKLIYTSGK